MKKINLLLVILTLTLSSCSKSEVISNPVQYYKITVTPSCSVNGAATYCVSKTAYEDIKAVMDGPLRPCPFFNFTTMDGVKKSGYLSSYWIDAAPCK
jgi:hypothetical protein